MADIIDGSGKFSDTLTINIDLNAIKKACQNMNAGKQLNIKFLRQQDKLTAILREWLE